MTGSAPQSPSVKQERKPPHRFLFMGSLILAGESIYMLPYMRKSFQTSMEATFELTSFQIGTLNALFGILALICYLPGGWLADRFSARRLLTLSLAGTGLGGLYMASLPGYAGLLAVHAFWGVFSILTFWAALIKATRLWSGASEQGRAFGILDGGRGVVGAGLASIAAASFALSATTESGLISVIIVYSIASLAAGIAIWFVVPDDHATVAENESSDGELHVLDSIGHTLRIPDVWLIAVVIFCAYFAFLGTYEFPAFTERGFDKSKAFGAWLGAFRDWLRPVAAVLAGVIADRVNPSRAIGVCFAMLVVSYGSLWLLPPAWGSLPILATQVTATALAVFALRGIYFALLEETGIPLHLTGIAVGTISMLAFTPDIFAPLLAGWLVDNSPGIVGYQRYFAILAVTAMIGLAAVIAIRSRESASRKVAR